ncbi:MAG: acetylglutamate kinase [Planctomycetota bacterium]
MRILVKIGGAQLEERSARSEFALAARAARDAGHELVVVHGGGNQIRDLVRKLALVERYHDGLRVTDAATADVVLQVLAGLVNKELVASLCAAGVRAAGACGADGASFGARRTIARDIDLGYVGTVASVDPALATTLLRGGFTPVLATCAPLARGESGPDEHFYNINADLAVGPLAAALRADAILFLTDVEGVRGADGARIAELDAQTCAALRASGVLSGGMIPKVEAALTAHSLHPNALVKIAPAAGASSIERALSNATGTTFVQAVFTHG